MDALKILNNRIDRDGLKVKFKGQPVARVNRSHWQNFVKAYGFKADDEMSFDHKLQNETHSKYSYSQKAIEFVYELLKTDPEGALDEAKRRVQER